MEPIDSRGETREAVPGPLADRPFLWLLAAHGVSELAFWAYFGTVFAEAAFKFHAGSRQMAFIGISLSVPFIFGTLLQGLVVDRWSPKWLFVLGGVAAAAAVPMAWWTSSIAWLYASSAAAGAAFGAIEPARSALTGLLVEESQLVRANGALSVVFQISAVVGTLGGGVLLEWRGSDLVYATALVVAVASLGLALVIPDIRQHGERPASVLRDLVRGAETSWRDPELRLLVFVTGLGWMLLNLFFILEPLLIRRVLHQGDSAVLFLWGMHAVGALAGATAVTRAKKAQGRESALVAAGVVAAGAGMLVYAGVGIYVVAFLGAAMMGVGLSLFFAPLLALIQRVVAEDQRGRVTSAFLGLQESMGVISSLSVVALGGLLVLRPTLVGGAVMLVAIGAFGLWGRLVLRRRGVLNAVRVRKEITGVLDG